jgi:uncharacterized membrane protein
MVTRTILGSALAVALGMFAGCGGSDDAHPQAPNAVKEDVQHGVEKAGEGVEKAGDGIEKGTDKVQEKLRDEPDPDR